MAGGKGKSTGGKAGPKDAAAKSQKSHSAKAGLQVSSACPIPFPGEILPQSASHVDDERVRGIARQKNNNIDESKTSCLELSWMDEGSHDASLTQTPPTPCAPTRRLSHILTCKSMT